MTDRDSISKKLNDIEQEIKDLQLLYEKYFSGAERLEPTKARQTVTRKLRLFSQRHITQTDLRFRYQTLATRFHTYANYWDRILRQIEEGRYMRHLARTQEDTNGASKEEAKGEVKTIHRELLEAHKTCKFEKTPPNHAQIADFLKKQRTKIQQKFGDQEVEFKVVIENDKPKIQVRPKKTE